MLVCALQLLLNHDELVCFVQVIESTSCLNLLLILGLSAQDELPELLLVITVLDILQRARIHCAHKVLFIGRRFWHSDCMRPCRVQLHHLLLVREHAPLLVIETLGALFLSFCSLHGEEPDLVVECIGDVCRVLSHADAVEAFFDRLLFIWDPIQLIIDEFVAL